MVYVLGHSKSADLARVARARRTDAAGKAVKMYRVQVFHAPAMSGSCGAPRCLSFGSLYLAVEDGDTGTIACSRAHTLLAAMELVRYTIHGNVRCYRVETFELQFLRVVTILEASNEMLVTGSLV
ncbi:MAG: hypothetical protein M3N13_01555 [Candidatus Eremiobacteraeota bacterium]|nr:hypothetical protein [Candidatus Eremiobacteraeota bacterium]